MKRCYAVFVTILLTLTFLNVTAQKRIAVIGSSTAFGNFDGLYPRDSGFVFLLKEYYKDLGLIDTIYNIAMSATNCYQGMPTGYQPPVGRKSPDPSYNITRAISFDPKPDVVLVSYPSNDYGKLSDEEIIYCLDSIRNYALANGVQCYITSTQPRDDYWSFEGGDGLCRLRHVNDLIMNYFGEYAIDFYTDIATVDCKRKPEFALEGDFIHLNPAGHRVLENKVIEKNILFGVVAINFVNAYSKVTENTVTLNWQISNDHSLDYFKIARSTNGINFQEVARIPGTNSTDYHFVNKEIPSGKYFYTITAVEKSGRMYQSKVVPAVINGKGLITGKIFMNHQKISVEILNAPGRKVTFQLINMTGQVLFNEQRNFTSGTFEKDISSVSPGTYVIVISSKDQMEKRIIQKL